MLTNTLFSTSSFSISADDNGYCSQESPRSSGSRGSTDDRVCFNGGYIKPEEQPPKVKSGYEGIYQVLAR